LQQVQLLPSFKKSHQFNQIEKKKKKKNVATSCNKLQQQVQLLQSFKKRHQFKRHFYSTHYQHVQHLQLCQQSSLQSKPGGNFGLDVDFEN
jgi:predicted flavoprotein YhiN